MPILANFLLSVFSGFAAWLAKYLTQKVAVTVAIVAIATALFVGMYVTMRIVVSAAIGGAYSFSPMFGAGIAMVISPRTAGLLSSYVLFWSACELYKWKVNLVQLWTKTI